MASVASPYYPSGCSATGRNETEDPTSSSSICNSHIRKMSYVKSSIPCTEQPATESSSSSDGSDFTGSKYSLSEKSLHEQNAISSSDDSTGREVFPDAQSDNQSNGKEIECMNISALSTAAASSPLHQFSCAANASATQPPYQTAAAVARTVSYTKSLTTAVVSNTTHDAFAAVTGAEFPSSSSCTATMPAIFERAAATAVVRAAEYQKQQTPRTKKKMLLLAAESTVRRANSTPSFLHYACKNRTLPLKSSSWCNPPSSRKSPTEATTRYPMNTKAADTQHCQPSSLSSAATAATAVDRATSASRPAAATTEAVCLPDVSSAALSVSPPAPTSSSAVNVASSPGVVTVSTGDIIAGVPSLQKEGLLLSPGSVHKTCLSASTITTTTAACSVDDACIDTTDAAAMMRGLFCVYESSVATSTLLSDRKSPLAAALLSLTRRNMQELYDSVNFLNKGWREETKRRELQHRDARYLLVFSNNVSDPPLQQQTSAHSTLPSQASSTDTANITATGASAAAQRTTSGSESTSNSKSAAAAESVSKATEQHQATPIIVSNNIATPQQKRGNRDPSCSDKISKNSTQPSEGTTALTPKESATQQPAVSPISAEKDDSELLHQLPPDRLVGFLHFRFEVEEGHAVAYIYELQVEKLIHAACCGGPDVAQRAFQRLCIGRRLMLLLELACRGFNRQMQKEYQERQQQIAPKQQPQQGDGDKKQQQGQESSQQQQQGEHQRKVVTQKQPLGVTLLNSSRQAFAHEVDRKQTKRCSAVGIEKRRNRQQEKVVQQPLRIEKLMCTVIKANKGAVRFYKQFCRFETDESDPSNFTSSMAGWSSGSNCCSNRQSEDQSQAATKTHTPTRGKDAGKAARRLLQTFQKEEDEPTEEECEYEILKKML